MEKFHHHLLQKSHLLLTFWRNSKQELYSEDGHFTISAENDC